MMNGCLPPEDTLPTTTLNWSVGGTVVVKQQWMALDDGFSGGMSELTWNNVSVWVVQVEIAWDSIRSSHSFLFTDLAVHCPSCSLSFLFTVLPVHRPFLRLLIPCTSSAKATT